MAFKLTPISSAIFIATFVNLFVAYSSWRRRRAKGGIYFALGMLATTFWTLCAALDYAAVPASLKVSFAKLEYLGNASALALFAAFAIAYAGYEDWLKKIWVRFLLIGIPAITVLLAWTNELHGWVWAGFEMSDLADNVLVFRHGPAFTGIVLAGYVLVLIIFVSLLTATLKGTALARKQARVLLGALIALVASNLLYLLDVFNIPGVDWSSITFSITGLFFLFALYGSRFLDIVPIARTAIIERMMDGVLVLDTRGNLVDFNPAAQRILGLQQADLWTPPSRALTHWPALSVWLDNPTQLQAMEIALGAPARIFDLRPTFLTDSRKEVYGVLVVMRDITESKRMNEALKQSEVKFYKAFHASPDAILLTRASDGRLMEVNEGFARLTGYSREEVLSSSTIALGFWVNPQDRENCVAALHEGRSLRDIEYDFRTKSGEILHGLYFGEMIELEGEAYILSVIRNITARKQMENEVRQAKEVAESANAQLSANLRELAARNEELDAFAHTVAHDIRSPVAQIISYAQALDQYQDELAPEERVRLRRIIVKSGDKLIRIINELVLLAGLRGMEVQPEPLNMAAVVAEAYSRVIDLIEQTGAMIALPGEAAWPIGLGYPAWVEEVWVNYLSNACKYGGFEGQPPSITLGADFLPSSSHVGEIIEEGPTNSRDPAESYIRFWIRDTGRGLMPEDRARLFTPFTRLDQVRATGHGLGLSIVRRIVEKLGGEVGVDSDGVPGHGSTFYFTLRAAPSGMIAPVLSVKPIQPTREQITLRGLTVLIVDDDTLFAQSVRSLLTARGLEVVGIAHNGAAAQDLANTLDPALVLMDIDMPGQNGLETTRLIKAAHPRTRIVMFTASEREEHLFEAIRYGASGYLLKGAPAEVFFSQLSALARGESPLSPGLANRVLAEFARLSSSSVGTTDEHAPQRTDKASEWPAGELTDRQWDILERVARGQTYKQIGVELNLSEQSIKYHMGQIIDRLHVTNRTQAVAYLRRKRPSPRGSGN